MADDQIHGVILCDGCGTATPAATGTQWFRVGIEDHRYDFCAVRCIVDWARQDEGRREAIVRWLDATRSGS